MKINVIASAFCGLAGLTLTACASPTYNYQPDATEISAPPLNVVSKAMVGDRMLEQGKRVEQDAIRLTSTVSVGVLGAYTFSPGDYLKRGQNAEGEFYNPGNAPNSGHVQVSSLADPFQTILLESDGTTLCGVSVLGGKVCQSNVAVERIKLPSLTSDSFQQTLVYNGKVGDKINVGYREFSGDMARPAFSNEVEYDLKESKTIGYKNASIQIIEATNRYIKYIVHQNFNGASR